MNKPFEVVSDLTALHAIPKNYRYEGMEVIVANTYTNGVKQKFTLSSGITNASWVEGNVGGGGGGGGLPVQATDLLVTVTTDAEFTTALEDYWNYQWTDGAKYNIMLATGYVCTKQIDLQDWFAPNLAIYTQTTTTVDCAGFVANSLGVKAFIFADRSTISHIRGTFTGINGTTTAAVFALSSTFALSSNDALSYTGLTMSGFLAESQLYNHKTVYQSGTTQIDDAKVTVYNTNFNGESLKGNGIAFKFVNCTGKLNLNASGLTCVITYDDSEMRVDQTNTGAQTTTYHLLGHSTIIASTNQSSFLGVTTASLCNINENCSFSLHLNSAAIWKPASATRAFAVLDEGSALHLTGSNMTVDDITVVPNKFATLASGVTVNNAVGATYDYAVGKYTDVSGNRVGPSSTLHRMSIQDDSLLTANLIVSVTGAGATTIDYAPDAVINLFAAPGVAAHMLDLTNYAFDGAALTIVCLGANGIDALSWTGGSFLNEPTTAAPGDSFQIRWIGGAGGSFILVNSSSLTVQSITIVCSDETTALTAGAGKVTFRMPYAFTLQEVRASLSTAQTSGSIFTVDVNEAGASLFSTKLTIDNTEKTSTTAAIPAVISDTALADDAEITIDIDQIGDGTAKGLKVYLIGVKA